MKNEHLWWQHGIIYQIYPRSFKDSNGDGIGDLAGIISKLDYLQWLGITAIWISPFYLSPMADFGYDISDYTAVDPIFGSMEDFEQLLTEAHSRDIKVILDLVPNHSSDQHPWFKESRSSRDNPKRDWYLWHDPSVDGGVPNNWLSVFGGSAWEFDAATGQYYYHAFLKEQPDLNWRNPEVQNAKFEVMRFWLNKGIDGFRVDVMWHMLKDALWRDNPPNPYYKANEEPPYMQLIPAYSTDQPEVHQVVSAMRKVLNEYGDKVLIGEIYLPIKQLVTYYGERGSGVHMPFNFQLITLPWEACKIFAAQVEYEASLPENGWPSWVMSNHDQSRIASRVGQEQAKIAAMLLLTLRGTPTLYYGDELGMNDIAIPPEEMKDPQWLNQPGKAYSRDAARSPMQWDNSANAGFTANTPWLPVAQDYFSRNVVEQTNNPNSMLAFYRRLIQLRQNEDAFCVGQYIPLDVTREIMAYIRAAKDKKFLVAVNLGHAPDFLIPEHRVIKGKIIFSTHPEREGQTVDSHIELQGDEGIIVAMEE